ncbi:hypothetical protein JCM17846_11160 [Iodidimonas nitroreducens]|uniref:Uncharacterized protein n=1 Tax=Iodidimonas nitroreducens TaxID=1236968 RepID=A0A5A7N6R6_9PROT|nr:hypothetical protein JCM17846_11160 [Iodidimonas nitroreducens]
MHKARFRPYMFGQIGEKSDDIMFYFGLDLVDPRHLEPAALPHGFCRFRGMMPSAACASQAWASISNQMPNLLSADHRAVISGRE